MKLGELPKNMTRTSIPLIARAVDNGEDLFFVRFACQSCPWTVGFKTNAAGVLNITPDHACPETRPSGYQLGHKPIDPGKYIPEAEIRERERQANEQEMGKLAESPWRFGFEGFKYPRGGTPEVM
ncbi:hypothetical protein EPO05_06580 [Patescibacteria group bacterium]|nr:MAG: hypothetical protein EPO05_06580 [Patescibacteria group bacterium]